MIRRAEPSDWTMNGEAWENNVTATRSSLGEMAGRSPLMFAYTFLAGMSAPTSRRLEWLLLITQQWMRGFAFRSIRAFHTY